MSGPVPMSGRPARPNILLVVSDDHCYGDLSLRGSPDARTPNLDRLADSGTVFDNGYVSAPIYSPSREGLIAAAHQQRWGARWFDTSAFPPAGRPVMPEILQETGDRTGYFGKVHYGTERPGDRACPECHGFESSLYGLVGLAMGRLHYFTHTRAAVEEYGQATGRREHTLVVYLTDNGGSTCNYGDNTPLHGTKYSLFEGGVRVPLVVSWPGTVPADTRSQALVSALDLLPTFAAAAGAALPGGPVIDGKELRPVWEAADTAGADGGHAVLHFDTGFERAVRTPQWKLRWVGDTAHRHHLRGTEHTDIGLGLSLVPIGQSPDESTAADVKDQHPEVVQELLALREQWLQSILRADAAPR